MAEFLTMQEAEDKFGKKGRTNAALTLGIIGTALGAFAGNNAQNQRLCDELYKRREQDVQEKADLFARLGSRISELEKKEAATAAALPLMFELNKVNAERQLDHKIDGQLKYAYSDLCAPVPSISPLYCSPFTQYGTGMYAGQAASNWNAVNTAINSTCPSCTAQ